MINGQMCKHQSYIFATQSSEGIPLALTETSGMNASLVILLFELLSVEGSRGGGGGEVAAAVGGGAVGGRRVGGAVERVALRPLWRPAEEGG